jgi:2-keto-4-pentenoate hydratase/2-oxohepta-3-ene-1,7-dioic acid hydratase in catechol pathway
MWVATVLEHVAPVAVVSAGRVLPLGAAGLAGMRELAALDEDGRARLRERIAGRPPEAWRTLAGVRLGPAVPDPSAIYTVGLNYRAPGVAPADDAGRPERPLVYGKAASSVAGHGAVLAWDRSLTANVDAEVELGVVIGEEAADVSPEHAMRHVFGYTCINDVSSRDPWLDGDQWLIGKSMPGFCPVGPSCRPTSSTRPAPARLHHQRRRDPGRHDRRDAVLHRGGRSRTSAAT